MLPCLALSGVIFILDTLTPLGISGAVPYMVVVLICLRSRSVKIVFGVALACSILTILGFYFSPPGPEIWKAVANRMMAILGIWTIAVLGIQRERARRGKRRAQLELKILRGLLPICAGCKRIRDDDGCWNTIEVYVQDHSEAEFSHGICPECAPKLYPEVYSQK